MAAEDCDLKRQPAASSLGFHYQKCRDNPHKSVQHWLYSRRKRDGAEGLWRVCDNLYDFSRFMDQHPGGKDWLQITEGTDVTEAFECHHISSLPERMLDKFFVKKAATPRHSPYTFHEGDFYSALKRRVAAVIQQNPEIKHPAVKTCIFVDVLVVTVFIASILAAYRQSEIVAIVAGVFLGMNTVAAHNFVHMRNNFRRYYMELSLISCKNWAIMHALSHHLFPNTVTDLEISLVEPWVHWLPRSDKSLARRYFSCFFTPITYSFIFITEGIRRFCDFGIQKTDLIPLSIPAVMLLCAPTGSVMTTLKLWLYIIQSGSLYFGVAAFNGSHHHPSLFHDGDKPRDNRDWGLSQMDVVCERSNVSDVRGSWKFDEEGVPVVQITYEPSNIWTFIKVMIAFGHHTIHHLFPTIDHAHLHKLYPALEETLTEFRIPFKSTSFLSMAVGQFKQQLRTEVNTVPPSYLPKINNGRTQKYNNNEQCSL